MAGLVKDTTFLAVALGVQTLAALLGQPILNTNLNAEERGLVALLVTISSLAFDFLHLGSGQGVIFRIASGRPVWTVLSTEMLWSLLVAGVLLLAVPALGSLALLGPLDRTLVFLAWLPLLARGVAAAALGASGKNRYDLVAASGMLAALATLIVRALWVPRQPMEGELIATCLGVIFSGLPSLFLLFKTEPLTGPSWDEFRALLSYGSRSMGGRVFEMLSGRGLPLLVLPVLGAATVGVYVAMRAIPTLVVTGASLVTRPLFSRSTTMTDEQAHAVVAPLLRIAFAASVVIALLVVALAPVLVVLLAATKYDGAVMCLQLIVLQVPARVLWLIGGAHVSGSGRPEAESKAIVAGTIVSFAAAAGLGFVGGLSWLLVGEASGVVLTAMLLLRAVKDLRGIPYLDMLRPRRTDLGRVLETLGSLRRSRGPA